MSKVLNDVIVVSLDIRIWSGRKKLRPEDLTTSGRMPPPDLVTLGSKRLCNPDLLQPFLQVKRRAEARCQTIGVRFARAFAIPRAAAKPLLAELNGLAEMFQQARRVLLDTYDAELARWQAQHLGYERLIAAELLPKTVVASRLTFGYEVFAINALDGDGELGLLLQQSGAGNLTQGLVGALYQEVASESGAFIRHSLTGRAAVTHKFLRPVRAIRDKLAGLAFLDLGIAPLVGCIDAVLASVPPKGKIDGASLTALRGVVTLLTDPARMRAHGRALQAASGWAGPPPEAASSAPEQAGRELASPPLRTRARLDAFW
jgi:hypothetical protein